jgi:hypothetical protein
MDAGGSNGTGIGRSRLRRDVAIVAVILFRQ